MWFAVLHQQKYPACLAFPRQQPFNTLHKLPTDPKQDLRTNLNVASFHRGEIVLADAIALGEPLLRHVKAAHFPDAATYRIAGSLRADQRLGLTSSLLLAISSRCFCETSRKEVFQSRASTAHESAAIHRRAAWDSLTEGRCRDPPSPSADSARPNRFREPVLHSLSEPKIPRIEELATVGTVPSPAPVAAYRPSAQEEDLIQCGEFTLGFLQRDEVGVGVLPDIK